MFIQRARGTCPSGEAGQRVDEEVGYGHRRIGLWPRDGRMTTDGAAATWTDGAAAVRWTEVAKPELQLPDVQRSLHQASCGRDDSR